MKKYSPEIPIYSLSRLQALAVSCVYIAAYVGADWMSYVAPIAPFAITPWNPPPALSIAFLWLFGTRLWPALMVASFMADLIIRDFSAPLPFVAVGAVVTTFGYTILVHALGRVLPRHNPITTRRDLAWFLGLTAGLALPIAIAYVGFLTVPPTLLPREDVIQNILLFWVGDVIGIAVVTPVLLWLWQVVSSRKLKGPEHQVEAVLQAVAFIVALWLVFGRNVSTEFRYFYVLFLPLIWVALRQGFNGAVIAILGVQLGLVFSIEFFDHPPITALELQMVMLTLAITGQMLGIVVTERRSALARLRLREEEMNHVLRLAAASELSSALAHELNQPLAAIANYVRAARMMAEVTPPELGQLRETLVKAVQEVDRAGRVMHRLRDFYRTGSARLEPTPADQLVSLGVSSMSTRFSRHGVDFEVLIPQPAPVVMADRVQIEAVIHNLVGNAIDALKGIPKAAVSSEHARHIRVSVAVEGNETVFAIEDNGPGIPAHMYGNLFNPFETSKKEGLGLGLSICRSIVESHGGRIRVEPSKLGGACFKFTLPVHGE